MDDVTKDTQILSDILASQLNGTCNKKGKGKESKKDKKENPRK